MKASTTRFYSEDFFVEPGKEFEFKILFEGDVYVTQAQFSLEIPEGFEFVNKGTDKRPIYGGHTNDSQGLTWASNISGKVLTATLQDPEQIGTEDVSGVLAVVYLKASSDIAAGKHTFKLTNMVASDENAARYATDNQNVTATVTKDCNITISVNNAAFGTATLNPAAGTHKSGTSFTATATPATGYKFVKWSDGSTTNPYTFTLENDLDLKAEFEIQKFTIAFYEEDGTTKIEEKVYDYNSAITAPSAATKEGYTFAGWTPALPEKATVDGTYKATYTINKYKVKFVKDDGTTVVSESELEYGAAITAPANPTKEGHTFKAWSPAVDATVPAKDVTYKATYTVNKYKVAFVAEGTTVKEETLDFGTAITAPEAPAKEGYTFKSWGDVLATVPAQDVTYTAQYEINKYKVIYKVDGAEYQSVDVEFNAAITAIAAPTREGYTFSGWSAIPATMPAENVTVTGSFIVNQYKVTFVAGKETVKEETLDFGTTITAPEAPATSG